jgi:hypothetical protein
MRVTYKLRFGYKTSSALVPNVLTNGPRRWLSAIATATRFSDFLMVFPPCLRLGLARSSSPRRCLQDFSRKDLRLGMAAVEQLPQTFTEPFT